MVLNNVRLVHDPSSRAVVSYKVLVPIFALSKWYNNTHNSENIKIVITIVGENPSTSATKSLFVRLIEKYHIHHFIISANHGTTKHIQLKMSCRDVLNIYFQ